MTINETIVAIGELPSGDAQIWGVDIDNCPVEYICTFDEIKALADEIERLRVALEALVDAREDLDFAEYHTDDEIQPFWDALKAAKDLLAEKQFDEKAKVNVESA